MALATELAKHGSSPLFGVYAALIRKTLESLELEIL